MKTGPNARSDRASNVRRFVGRWIQYPDAEPMSPHTIMLRAVVLLLVLAGCQSGTRETERGAPAGYPIRYSIGSVVRGSGWSVNGF